MISKTLPKHYQAEKYREAGKFVDALKLYEEVILEYLSKKNYSNLIEALLGKTLTYKHIFLQSGEISTAILAKQSAQTAQKIAHKYFPKKLYHCYFRLGEIETILKNYKKAISFYSKSLQLFPENNAEKGDLIYHLGEVQYLSGDKKTGLDNLQKGLKVIKLHQSVTEPYNFNVWLSGCLIKLYKYTGKNNYLEEAQKIINSNPLLTIRLRQLEEINKTK